MDFKILARRVAQFASDNSPALLTAVGVAGTVTTAILTGRAAFKAANILSEEPAHLSTMDKVRITWPLYIPAVGVGCITVGCILMANSIGQRRAAAMAAAYTLSEKALLEYRDKVAEKLGPQKEMGIRDEIAQDQVTANPVTSNQVIIAGNGDVLCYDSFSGRYFTSSVENLKKAQNDINYQMLHEHYASLTEFYSKIGLRATAASDEFGWTADDPLELMFSAVLSDDGRPCISVNFRKQPVRQYYKFG